MRDKFLPILAIIFLSFTFACRPACPIASCQVRKVHHHGKAIYRGQPIWKKQNPNIGEGLPRMPRDNQATQRKNRQKNRPKP